MDSQESELTPGSRKPRRPLSCHCLCAVRHPGVRGICDVFGERSAVVYVEIPPNGWRVGAIPLCGPCRADHSELCPNALSDA